MLQHSMIMSTATLTGNAAYSISYYSSPERCAQGRSLNVGESCCTGCGQLENTSAEVWLMALEHGAPRICNISQEPRPSRHEGGRLRQDCSAVVGDVRDGLGDVRMGDAYMPRAITVDPCAGSSTP